MTGRDGTGRGRREELLAELARRLAEAHALAAEALGRPAGADPAGWGHEEPAEFLEYAERALRRLAGEAACVSRG